MAHILGHVIQHVAIKGVKKLKE